MINVVEKGTATNSIIRNIKIAGKTGTAENFVKINGIKKQLTDHSIFIGFAPANDPKIAVCVLLKMDIGVQDGQLNFQFDNREIY